MTTAAQVNFYCPEQRAAFMCRPCEGFWEKIAQARAKFPEAQFHFPLNKCVDCKGEYLVPAGHKEKAVEESDKGRVTRTKILEAMEKVIGAAEANLKGFTTKKSLASQLNMPVANLTYHLEKMKEGGLIQITKIGEGLPGQISWPTPKDAPLPDKAGEVRKGGEITLIVQEKGEKAGIVHVPPGATTCSKCEAVFLSEKCPMCGTPADPSNNPSNNPSIKLCKNNDGRPAHKTSPFCLECCREQLKQNQAKAKGKPKNSLGLSAEERLFNWTLENLPAFDPAWTQEVWERWNLIWGSLREIARNQANSPALPE